MLVSRTPPVRHEIPWEPGAWIEVRGFTWKQSRELAKLPDVDMRALEAGITAWSYDAPVNAVTIGDLDARTASWLARLLVNMLTGGPEGEASAAGAGTTT